MRSPLKGLPRFLAAAGPVAQPAAPARPMPRLLRTLLVAGAALAVAGVGAVWAWPIGEPERLGSLQGDAWRGAYLARASGCVTCHSSIDMGGAALAGGAPLDTPFGSFVPPNITPDPVGGIGGWTLDEFAVAVRQGVSPDGEAYYPAFPYEFYAGLSDQDVADIFAAIQAVPPVAEPAAPHDVSFPFNLRFGLKPWRAAFLQPVEPSPVMGRSEAWLRGQALVEGPTHCAACHTGRNLLGGLKASEAMAGSDALPGGSVAPSIRAEDLRARGWTAASLAYALRTGLAPDGDALGGSMAEVVHAGTSYLDEADREAIAAYILDVAAAGSAADAVAAERESMDEMSGMDHAGMPGMEGAASVAGASPDAGTTEDMDGMAGMDHAGMAGMNMAGADAVVPAAASVGPASDVELTAAVQQADAPMRPRARPRLADQDLGEVVP